MDNKTKAAEICRDVPSKVLEFPTFEHIHDYGFRCALEMAEWKDGCLKKIKGQPILNIPKDLPNVHIIPPIQVVNPMAEVPKFWINKETWGVLYRNIIRENIAQSASGVLLYIDGYHQKAELFFQSIEEFNMHLTDIENIIEGKIERI